MSTREPKRTKLWAVAEEHLPRGWTFIEHSPQRSGKFYGIMEDEEPYLVFGETDFDKKEIHCVRIVDRFSLAVFLHECAHAHMQHGRSSDSAAQDEFEAEMYAIKALRAAGLSAPRKYLIGARDYVAAHVVAEGGLDHSEEVLKFAYGRNWRDHQ